MPLWIAMWWSQLMVGVGPEKPHASRNLFLDGWFRWDSFFYFDIARRGYLDTPDAWDHRDTNFWPMFPLLLRGATFLTPGGDMAVAAFVLDNALLLAAIALFDDVAERALGKERKELATTLLLVHPMAFYYSAGYSESSFLFFSLLTFFFGYRRRWLGAGIAAACAGASRAPGSAAFIGLVVLYLEEHGWSLKKIRPDFLFVLSGGLGALGYMLYLKLAFGDATAFAHGLSARDWGRDVTFARFLATMKALISVGSWPLDWIQATDTFHALCLAIAAGVTLAGARRLRPHLTVFALVVLVMSVRYWSCAARYTAPIFPLYLVGASVLAGRARWTQLVTTAGLVLMMLFAFLYGHWYWVS
ncbi:MAG TPA: mannosyltransferase family protein [Labilithrix sp.]